MNAIEKNYQAGLSSFRERFHQSTGKVADLLTIAAEMSADYKTIGGLDRALAIFTVLGPLRALDPDATLSAHEFEQIIGAATTELLSDPGELGRQVLEQRHALSQECKAKVGLLSDLVEQVFAHTADPGICYHTLAMMVGAMGHYEALAQRLEELHKSKIAAKENFGQHTL